MCFSPSLREISLQLGGKIEETRTMLHAAIPAFRSANSKLDSRSRCFPTPLVRKIFLATNAMVPVCGASVEGACKILRCGKVTRRFCSVNSIPRIFGEERFAEASEPMHIRRPAAKIQRQALKQTLFGRQVG